MPRGRPKGTAAGIGRSLRLYYGPEGRSGRLDACYAQFVPAGGLVFDIGAHVGDRTASFRRLGARVVAVEPQPGAMRALRLIHGRDRKVALVCAALGDGAAAATLRLNVANPTVSTTSAAFIEAANDAEGWSGERWSARVAVPTLTLDGLVARHGRPDFVKIDVEGAEDRVLGGLTAPLPSISFEATTIQPTVAARCIARLQRLGRYEFNASFGETLTLARRDWVCGRTMADWLVGLPARANSLDVHARLVA